MKKELLLASLMLTSPAALAQADSNNQTANLPDQDLKREAKWIFESDEYIRIPRYDFIDRGEDSYSKFSHFDVLKASVHFFPVDSSSDLFDFTLDGFEPIKKGEQEFEVSFRTQDISNDLAYFEGDSAYYAIKKDDTVFLFDCDSTKRCDAGPNSTSFAVLKLKKDNSIKFVHTADHFYTPYGKYSDQGEYKDLGSSLTFKLKK